jgi:predicted component of type VI protein secretion system
MPVDFNLSITGRQKIALENMINRDYQELINTLKSNDLDDFTEEDLREVVSQLDMALSLKQTIRDAFDSVYDKTKGVLPNTSYPTQETTGETHEQ